MKEIDPAEILSDHDVQILKDMSSCLLTIWSREIQEKKRTKIYDNRTLDEFMSEFTLMIDDLQKNKNIKNYISHALGRARLEIDAPVSYE